MTRAHKICPEPYCPCFVPCPTHGHKPWAGSARDRGLRTVTSGHRQTQRANYVIARDDTICHICGYPGADQADHVIALAHHGVDDITNMAPIHAEPCHREKTAREAHAA